MPSGYDFTAESVKTSTGVWEPQYAYGYGARWVAGWTFKETTGQAPTAANTTQKRIDEGKSLELTPYEELDKAQVYANAGDTMPILFCKRVNNQGGIWVSPPLLDSSCDNFEHTFIYLLSHGYAFQQAGTFQAFLGKRNILDAPVLGGAVYVDQHYSNDSTVCPIAAYTPNCNHTNFNFFADPVGATVGDGTSIRTVNNYSTGVTIRVKALYPVGSSSPTTMSRYTLTVTRRDNSTNVTTTVGTVTTNATSGITSISDTTAVGNYTYKIINTALHTAGTIEPETILVEFRQSNTFPTSYDRTTSYKNITLLSIVGNIYDDSRVYSPPSQLKQFHIFAGDGIVVDRWRFVNNSISNPGGYTNVTGSSNNFADLLFYWYKNAGKYPNQNFVYLTQYDVAACALFFNTYNITCNIYLSSSINFYSWCQGVAPMFLCSFYTRYGSNGLKPVLPLTDAGAIKTTALTPLENFNDLDTSADSIQNSIIAGSYQKTYRSSQERIPSQIVVSWRGQNNFNLETTQTTTVRYSDYDEDVPEDAYDMTEFCTNADHATLFAKYVLATRRYSLHTVTFQTGRNVEANSALEPFDLISVSLSRVNSAGDSRTETEYYLVDNIEYDQQGLVTITASQFPLNGSGASIISNSILSGSFVVTT